MHKHHMAGCVIAVVAAVAIVATTGGSIGGLGLLLAVLICPVTMGAAMWFLMGSQRRDAGHGNASPQTSPGEPSTRTR